MTKKINLYGQEFEIEEVIPDEIEGNWGYLFRYNSKIKIAKYLGGFEKLSTILHEINHQIAKHSGLSHKYKEEELEYILDVFANGWASIILLNDDLMEILNG